MPYYGFDSTYFLVLIGIVIVTLSHMFLNSTFSAYSKKKADTGMYGHMVARRILDENGLYDVEVRRVAGSLTDHYNPADRSVNLSEATYDKNSIAAVSVAAHECGHAIQHAKQYAFLNFRSAFFPLASIGGQLAIPLIMIGFILGSIGGIFITIGIVMFLATVIFQVITLPVEFNASSRALVELEKYNIVTSDEIDGSKKVLTAAALTYVAATISSVLQLLRLIILSNRRSR